MFVIRFQKNRNKVEKGEIEELYIAARGKLYHYAHCLTWDFDRADDLLQETAFKMLSNAHQLKNEDGFIKWARKIMHNTFISSKNREERHQSVDDFAQVVPFTDKDIYAQNSDCDICVDEIYNAIDDLPGNYGTLIRLLIKGHKYVDISIITNIPLGTVKTRIHISRQLLKEKLKDYLN